MGLLLVVAGPIAAEALAEEEVVEVHGAIDHRRRVSPGRPTAATRVNHVWTWDFIHDRTEDGRALKILTVMDEYSRFNLCLHVSRSITAEQVIEQLELAMVYGKPDFVRSDNGPEFIATAISAHLNKKQIGIIYIAPGSPWENPYVESFYIRLRDECLNREIFTHLLEALMQPPSYLRLAPRLRRVW